MRSTEGRQEVVEGKFVGDVYGGYAQIGLQMIAAENVVPAGRHVEHGPGRDSRWIAIVVLGSGLWERE